MITSRNMLLLAVATWASFAFASESDFLKQVKQQDGWVGYHVSMVAGSGSSCCYSGKSDRTSGTRGCNLDSGNGVAVSTQGGAGAAGDLSVYWHVVNGRTDQVQAYSADCPVTSNKAVRWIESVQSADSIGSIAQWVESSTATREGVSSALTAIALHADAEATTTLIGFAAIGKAPKLREESIFWLGQTRGAPGADFIERVATTDPSDDIREHAVFSLSQSDVKDAYDRVLGISKSDTSADVRGKALFWMAQMEDPRAQADIVAALDTETSSEVREEAVFALSQLDEKSATSALISVIRGNYPPRGQGESPVLVGRNRYRRGAGLHRRGAHSLIAIGTLPAAIWGNALQCKSIAWPAAQCCGP